VFQGEVVEHWGGKMQAEGLTAAGLSDQKRARALKRRCPVTFNPLPPVFVLG